MGDVHDFRTGEIIKLKRIPKRCATRDLIESLYQRRHQIDDIILIYNDKVNGVASFGMSCKNDLDRRILASFFNEYVALYGEPLEDE